MSSTVFLESRDVYILMLYYVYTQSGTSIKIQLALHETAQGNTQLCHAVSSYAGKPKFYICNRSLLEIKKSSNLKSF